LQSRPLVEYCQKKGIRVEAWSPLMQGGDVLRDRTLIDLAKHHGKTVAQIILRWDVQCGVVTIPKSVKPHRLAENAGIFDFELSDLEMATIAALDRGQRVGPDPANFGF
jgi:methylglyoxal/glyoxal reductase